MNDWGSSENIQSDVTFFLGKRGDSRRSSTRSSSSNVNGGHFENSNSVEADDQTVTNAFCCRENLEDCLRYLSQELGADSSTLSPIGRKTAVNLVSLANSVYDLLLRHRRSLRRQEELESKHRRANCDLEHSQSTVAKLHEILEQKDRTLGSAIERERQLLENSKVLQAAIKCEREEVKRLNAIVAQRDAQYAHDSRKSEREKGKLRERCQQLLMDKTTGKRFSEIEILNPVQRSDGSRSKWKTPAASKRNVDDFHQATLKSLEDRCKLLVSENQSWRDNAAQMHFCLENVVHSLDPSHLKLNRDLFQLPCEMILPTLEKSLKEKVEQLENFIQMSGYNQNPDERNSVRGGTLPTFPPNNLSWDGDILEEKSIFTRQRQLFNEQRARFYKERREFTDAVLRLGSTAQGFEEFEKEKAEFLKLHSTDLTECSNS